MGGKRETGRERSDFMIETAGAMDGLKETAKELGNSQSDIPTFVKDLEPSSILSFEEASKPLYATETDVSEARADQIAENREKGAEREELVFQELLEQYPPEEGYKISQEQYLRDEDGNIVKDSETGEARRIDFVVTKDGEVVKSVEVTSETASKTEQLAKEARIREDGGNFIKDRETGELCEITNEVETEVWRRP